MKPDKIWIDDIVMAHFDLTLKAPGQENPVEYIRADGIFSCEKCGDSGKVYHTPVEGRTNFGKPCPCRNNPLSIYNLTQRARR